MTNIKDILTTIAGVGLALFVAIQQYLATLAGEEINWINLAFAVVVAVIGFFTGRNHDGSKKVNPTKA